MTEHKDYILMVEDNDDDVVLALRSFKKNNFPFEVVVARNGAIALSHLFDTDAQGVRKNPKAPILVLLDLNLPMVRGIEVLKAIRSDALLKDLPVLILSSSNEERDRTETRLAGANLYLRKPINHVDTDNVTRQIQDFLAGHRSAVDPPAVLG